MPRLKLRQMEPESAQESDRPTMRDVYPPWGEINDKWLALTSRENELIQQLKTIDRSERKLNKTPHLTPRGENVITPARKPKTISESARQILGDLLPREEPVQVPIVVQVNPFDQARAPIGREIEFIREAMGILLPEWRRARAEASRRLCQALLEPYRPVAERVCAALVELVSACAAHDRFTSEIASGGGDFAYLRPVVPRHFLPTTGTETLVRRTLAWADETGHFDRGNWPAELIIGTRGTPKSAE